MGLFLKGFIDLSEKIGKSARGLLKMLSEYVYDVEKYRQEIGVNDQELLKKYLQSHDTNIGSIYEWDDASKLIFNILSRLKFDSKEPITSRETVLIIDDLDRLDPEHIFRLFNVFSAHYDNQNEKNKFGFDKVIFVCDVENVRKIFHYKYGLDVEFNGYIDEFL